MFGMYRNCNSSDLGYVSEPGMRVNASENDFDTLSCFSGDPFTFLGSSEPKSSQMHEQANTVSYQQHLPAAPHSKMRIKNYHCPHCPPGKDKRFTNSNDLARHSRTVHGILNDGDLFWKCPCKSCPSAHKMWPRLDNFKAHVLRMHGAQYHSQAENAREVFDSSKHDQPKPSQRSKNINHYRTDFLSSSPTKPDPSEIRRSSSSTLFPCTTPLPTVTLDTPSVSDVAAGSACLGPDTMLKHKRSNCLWSSGRQQRRKDVQDPDITRHEQWNIDSVANLFENRKVGSMAEEQSSVNDLADEDEDIRGFLDSDQYRMAQLIAFSMVQAYHQLPESDKLPLRSCPAQPNTSGGRGGSHQPTKDYTATSTTAPKKRRRLNRQPSRGRNDDDDSDGREPDFGPSPAETSSIERQRSLACPFHKADALSLAELDTINLEYRHCGTCLLRDIPTLKQHLYRVHCYPDFYCPTCYKVFAGRIEMDTHIRQRNCNERANPFASGKMSSEAYQTIKQKKRGSQEEVWYAIFATLFPHKPRPSSPYADGPEQYVIEHLSNIFRSLGPGVVDSLINQLLLRAGSFPLPRITQRIVDEAYVIFLAELLSAPTATNMHYSASMGTSATVQQPMAQSERGIGSATLSTRNSSCPMGSGNVLTVPSAGQHSMQSDGSRPLRGQDVRQFNNINSIISVATPNQPHTPNAQIFHNQASAPLQNDQDLACLASEAGDISGLHPDTYDHYPEDFAGM